MKRVVTEADACRSLDKLLNDVAERGDEVVIERDGERIGVIVPPKRYDSMELHRRRRLLDFMNSLPAGDDSLTEEEAMQLAVDEVRAYRAEQRSKRRRLSSIQM